MENVFEVGSGSFKRLRSLNPQGSISLPCLLMKSASFTIASSLSTQLATIVNLLQSMKECSSGTKIETTLCRSIFRRAMMPFSLISCRW